MSWEYKRDPIWQESLSVCLEHILGGSVTAGERHNAPSPKSAFCVRQNSARISLLLSFLFWADFKAACASATVANSMKANLQQEQMFN